MQNNAENNKQNVTQADVYPQYNYYVGMQNATVPIHNQIPMQGQAVCAPQGQNYIAPQATQSYIQPSNPAFLQPYVIPTQSLPFVNNTANYAPAYQPIYPVAQPIQTLQYVPQTAYVPGYNAALQEQMLRSSVVQYPQNMPSAQTTQTQNYMPSVNQMSQDTQTVQTPPQVVQSTNQEQTTPQVQVPVQPPQAIVRYDTPQAITVAQPQPYVNLPLQPVCAMPAQTCVIPPNVPLMMPVQQSASRVFTNQTRPTTQQSVTTNETPRPEVQQVVSSGQVQQGVAQNVQVQNVVQENPVNVKQQSNHNVGVAGQAEPVSNRTVHSEQNNVQTKTSHHKHHHECPHHNRYRNELNILVR